MSGKRFPREIDLRWFEPREKQLAFIRSNANEVIYAGGFGSGKTISGGFKALAVSLAYPGTVGLIGRQTGLALRDTTQKVILEGDDKPPIIPPELIAHRSEAKNVTTIKLVNGSEILFRSFQDWNPFKLRSLNLGWFYLDECVEASEKLWLELKGRLRFPIGPRQGFGTTNPNGHDWVWRRTHPDSPVRQEDSELLIASTLENDTLPPDYIQSLLSMPAEWVKRYVYASFDQASGAIWDMWTPQVHVVPEFEVPYQWKRFESLDHGRRNPTAYLQYAVDHEGFLLVIDGYYSPGLVQQHATAIKVKRGNRKWPAVVTAPDAFNMGNTGQRVSDIYREHGIEMVRANDNVDAGLLRVSEWLTRNPTQPFPEWHPWGGTLGPDELGSPMLFVLENEGTRDLRLEIPDYRWKDLSPIMEERQDQPEEPRKKDDHAADALRYGVMSQPRPTPTAADVLAENAEREAERRERADEHRAVTSGLYDRKF